MITLSLEPDNTAPETDDIARQLAEHPFDRLPWRLRVVGFLAAWWVIVAITKQHLVWLIHTTQGHNDTVHFGISAPIAIVGAALSCGGAVWVWRRSDTILDSAPRRIVLPLIALVLVAVVFGYLVGTRIAVLLGPTLGL